MATRQIQIALLKALSYLPLPLLYLCADIGHIVLYHVLRYERRLVEENIARAFPEKTASDQARLSRQSYRNILSVLAEVLKSPRMDPSDIKRRVQLRNPELLIQYTRNEQSVIALAAHHCNWEWLLLGCCVHLPVPVDAVYKPIKRPYLDSLLLESRTRFGAHLIPARDTVAAIMQRHRELRLLAMVADQAPRREDEKHWSRFLHQDTAFYPGAGRIAVMTGKPVVFIGMRRIRRGYYEISVEPICEDPHVKGAGAVMEQYIQAVERQVRESPADWLWFYQRWKYAKPLYA